MNFGKRIINILDNILILVFFSITFCGFYLGYLLTFSTYGSQALSTFYLFLSGGIGLLIATLFTGILSLFLSIDRHLCDLHKKIIGRDHI